MRSTKAFVSVLLGISAIPLLSGPAAASEKESITLHCGNSGTYTIWTNGNGTFTPGHIVGSTRVLVPHAFGPGSGQLVDTDGNVVDTFSEPASVQGSGKQKGDVTCTFSASFTSDGSDPEGPPAGYVFTFSGSVTGKLSGR